MSKKIGIDFGTTYSFMSYCERTGGMIEPEMCVFDATDRNSITQDSLVVKVGGGTYIGSGARMRVSEDGAKIYRAFKMMLSVDDKDALASRGYEGDITPETVTKEYLAKLIDRYKKANNIDGKLDKTTVGVPATWFDGGSPDGAKSRERLEAIIRSIGCTDKVELVSEPAAACTYCAFDYKRKNKEDYNGYILVIDYGGGTLDTALCRIDKDVNVMAHYGAGETTVSEHGHQAGAAGVAFIDEIIKLTVRTVHPDMTDNEIIGHKDYNELFNYIENYLKDQDNMEQMKEYFGRKQTNTEREELEFLFIEKKNIAKWYGIDSDITYGTLAKAFNNIISPVLNGNLDKIIKYIKDNRIPWGPGSGDSFKVAMVGGFCRFYLTRAEIELKLEKRSKDKRFILLNAADAEYAISYGAALIADGEVNFKHSALYHLFIKDFSGDPHYFFRKGAKRSVNERYYIENEDKTRTVFTGKPVKEIFFNLSDDCTPDQNGSVELRGKAWDDAVKNIGQRLYNLAVSFDENMKPAIHVCFTDPDTEEISVKFEEINKFSEI